MTNPQDEAQRLRELYAGMSEGELVEVAGSGDELTEEAETLLREEMNRRGLPLPGYDVQEYSEPVTIRPFRDLSEALLAKGKLEAAGIACFLVNENMVRMNWLYSNFLGNVRLQVHPGDAENALSILDEPIPERLDVEGVGEVEQPRCPMCHSLDIRYESIMKDASRATMVFVPIPIPADRWMCNACGQYWQEVPDEDESQPADE